MEYKNQTENLVIISGNVAGGRKNEMLSAKSFRRGRLLQKSGLFFIAAEMCLKY